MVLPLFVCMFKDRQICEIQFGNSGILIDHQMEKLCLTFIFAAQAIKIIFSEIN